MPRHLDQAAQASSLSVVVVSDSRSVSRSTVPSGSLASYGFALGVTLRLFLAHRLTSFLVFADHLPHIGQTSVVQKIAKSRSAILSLDILGLSKLDAAGSNAVF